MSPEQFQRLFEKRLNDIKAYAKNDLPRHIGKLAVDHYHQNFMRGGFVDDALIPWIPAKRIGQGGGAGAGYGTLLSSRKELYNSIRSIPGDSRVVISSALRHSKIHNEGGQITQPITPKMRKFAWAKYYESGKTNEQMKGLALTKRTTRSITIPQRRYMGRSSALNRAIYERIYKDVKRIILAA